MSLLIVVLVSHDLDSAEGVDSVINIYNYNISVVTAPLLLIGDSVI